MLDELGQGGMGVVYRCLDTVGGVKVAVKMLPPEVAHNLDEMDSIRANYQLVANLSHANIAGVRTLEKDAHGDYYLVMNLARGENFSRWMRHHPAATQVEKLAILAYKLLAGELPFDADDPVVLGQAVLNAPVPKIPGVPACVNAAFAKALAKKPEDRFSSCAAFLAVLEGKVKTASSRSLVKWIAVASIVLVAIIGVCCYFAGRASAPRSPSSSERARVPRDRAAGETRTVTLPGGAKLELVWCQDWKDDYPDGAVTDPTGPASGSDRVLRGGGWFNDAGVCRSASRGNYYPSYRGRNNLGFRVCCSAGSSDE